MGRSGPATATAFRREFRTKDNAGTFVVTTRRRSAETIHPHTVGVFVNRRVMIENIPVLGFGHCGASAEAVTFDRRLAMHHPIGPVEVVYERLDHVVAGEPREMILRAALPL